MLGFVGRELLRGVSANALDLERVQVPEAAGARWRWRDLERQASLGVGDGLRERRALVRVVGGLDIEGDAPERVSGQAPLAPVVSCA